MTRISTSKRVPSDRSAQAQRPRYSTDRVSLEREVVVQTFRASGPGGQHRNVTNSAVRLRHLPSGVTVVATESRSQHRNREKAFSRLIARLEAVNHVPKRRIVTRTPRRVIEERLSGKGRRKAVKHQRRGVIDDKENH